MQQALRHRPVSIAAPAAALAALAILAAGTAACGSSESSSVTNVLAGQSGQQIVARALADGAAAARVRLTSSETINGTPLTSDLTMVRGKGCEGTMGVPGAGSIRVLIIGATAWIKPDSQFWQYYQSTGGSPVAGAQLAGKYLKMQASDMARDGFAGINGPCTASNMFSEITIAGTGPVTTTTINFQPALKIAVTGISTNARPGEAYVSDTDDPELLLVEVPGPGGTQITVTYPATPVTVTPPPASQVVSYYSVFSRGNTTT
jgi:hypothetical protein